MMTTPTLATDQCGCPTCRDTTGRAAVIADLIDQCCCSAESICSACHALGSLTERRRCQSCREWTPIVTAGLCDDCASDRDDKEWWDGSDR